MSLIFQKGIEVQNYQLCKRIAIAIFFAIGLIGCGGGGARSENLIRNSTVSKGQALIDLKRAHEQGALTVREYEAEKARIIKE